MSNDRTESREFREYAALLIELHRLIRSGDDEALEGDSLRDRMDQVGSQLSAEEVARANQMSAELYAQGDSRP
jgi:hypothetical protein